MRTESFRITDGVLFRAVTPEPRRGRGKPYLHACSKQVYEDVAYAIEQLGGRTFTGDDIRSSLGAPSTQVMVTLAFLKERGCIDPAHGRRNRAAERYTYEDALIEWHALAEGSPGSADAMNPHPVDGGRMDEEV